MPTEIIYHVIELCTIIYTRIYNKPDCYKSQTHVTIDTNTVDNSVDSVGR